MNVIIKPSVANGTVFAPPSKSYAHRMLIAAALAKGESTIHGISESNDIKATLECINSLGANYKLINDTVYVSSNGINFTEKTIFHCGESGSTLRFLIPIALLKKTGAKLTGTKRLIERGIKVYEEVFKDTGIIIKIDNEVINVRGKLTPGKYVVRGDVSSQFITGLLFALPLLKGSSVLEVTPPFESRCYANMTLDVLKNFGITIKEMSENRFVIPGCQEYINRDIYVEGDWSNGAFLFALNEIGGNVRVLGLSYNSFQGDKSCLEYFKRLSEGNCTIDISDCPDLGPVLFAVAAYKNGAVFTGTRRLKIKESDRASTMALELKKFGIDVDVFENSVIVHKGTIKKPQELLHGHNDHRIVMALSLLASKVGAEIDDAQAINKSYPEFFEVLKSLNVEVLYGI